MRRVAAVAGWVLAAWLLGIGLSERPARAQAETAPAETSAAGESAAEGPAPRPAPPPRPAAAPRAAARPAAAAAPEAESSTRPSEPAWVRGELRTNYRANPSPESAPLGVVKTGDQVAVLERRGGWAHIQPSEGPAGWIADNLLDPEAPPRERLAQLEAQVADLQHQLETATHESEQRRQRVDELAAHDADREEAMWRLSDENRDLRAGERWPYLVTGAGILGIGIAVGILLRGGPRRSSSRIRF